MLNKLLIILCVGIANTTCAAMPSAHDLQELTRISHELQHHMHLCAQYTAMKELTPLFLTPLYGKELQEIGPALAQSCTKKDELIHHIAALEKKLLGHGIPAALLEQIVVAGVLIKQNK